MKPIYRKSALAAAILAACASSSAFGAVRLSEAFNGNWFDPAAAGRGVTFSYIPNRDGGGTFFGATFTYDAQGNPLWLVFQPVMSEFQYEATGFDVFRLDGGQFGYPFTGANLSVVGSGSLVVNSCNSIDLTLNVDGIGQVQWPLVAANSAAAGLTNQGVRNCAFQREFTGCPSFATPVPQFGSRACQITGDFLNQDIRLTNEITWVMEGKVGIGGDNANTSVLRIEAGTLIVSSGDTFDHIAVNRGSKVYAEGRPYAPIIMTSPNELPGFDEPPAPTDVGGFVISGNAPANCNPNCVAEWDPTNRYGGNDPFDDSGVVRYMQVRYAGYIFTTNRELNSFTLNAVGAGTTLEYLQAAYGADDGIEFFGGTANVRYFVETCGGDDGIDWDEGYSGKMQYALVLREGCAGQDMGMELSNSPTNFDAQPRSTPTVANITLIGDGGGRDAIDIKEGTGGRFWNIVATGFARSCINIANAATQTAAGPANALTGVLTMRNSVIDCATNFRTAGGVSDGYAQAWFTSQQGNAVAPLNFTQRFLPTAQSPVFNKPFRINDDWFEPTDYAGAFRSDRPEDNWTLGWTYRLNPQL